MGLEDDIETILWTDQEIAERVAYLGSQITQDFKSSNKDETTSAPTSPTVLIGVATGAFIFLADLVRKISLPVTVDFIRVESYGSGSVSNNAPRVTLDLKVGVQGKHIILVEDIVDTGKTLRCLIAHLTSKGAASISVCTLLDKPSRRKVNFELLGNGKFYCGFECPDYFIVGYGLDSAELYRNLPFIGVLKPELYK